MEAAYEMTRGEFKNFRLFLSALLRSEWAARVETAALGHMVWGGDHPLDGGQRFVGLPLRDLRNGLQQTVRVRIAWRLEDRLSSRALENLASIRVGNGLWHFLDDWQDLD